MFRQEYVQWPFHFYLQPLLLLMTMMMMVLDVVDLVYLINFLLRFYLKLIEVHQMKMMMNQIMKLIHLRNYLMELKNFVKKIEIQLIKVLLLMMILFKNKNNLKTFFRFFSFIRKILPVKTSDSDEYPF